MKEVFNGYLKRVTVRQVVETSVLINVSSEEEAKGYLADVVYRVFQKGEPRPQLAELGAPKVLTSVEIESRCICDGKKETLALWGGEVVLND